MGYITENWLKGDAERRRSHSLRLVNVSCLKGKRFRYDAALTFEVTTPGNYYQHLHLTYPEIQEMLVALVPLLKQEDCTQLTLGLLKRMTETDLLKTLATDLKTRLENEVATE